MIEPGCRHCHAWRRFSEGHLLGGASSPAAPARGGGRRAACRRARVRATMVTRTEDLTLRVRTRLQACLLPTVSQKAHQLSALAVHHGLPSAPHMCKVTRGCSPNRIAGRLCMRMLTAADGSPSAHACCNATGANLSAQRGFLLVASPQGTKSGQALPGRTRLSARGGAGAPATAGALPVRAPHPLQKHVTAAHHAPARRA